MMIESAAARWLLTAVFAAAALPRRGPGGPVRRADRAAAVFCLVMCAALVAMTWRPEPAAAAWVEAAGFDCAALWFVLASRGSSGWFRRPGLTSLHLALMAAADDLDAHRGAWRGRDTAARAWSWRDGGHVRCRPGCPVLAVSGRVAACCAAASIPWPVPAIGPGLRVKDPAAPGHERWHGVDADRDAVTPDPDREEGDAALHLRVTELLVHGWDLARATGQPASFPDDLAEQELAFSRSKLADIPAGRRPFGPRSRCPPARRRSTGSPPASGAPWPRLGGREAP
jgi:hypothetical protein